MTKGEGTPKLVQVTTRKSVARQPPPNSDRRLKRLRTRNARLQESLRDQS